ncbi:MAG: 4Fe-4S binding protein [Oscillospiraceae bacterium]|nr:4Fe-4S binding protein [Oscillospiraceae bacterium]
MEKEQIRRLVEELYAQVPGNILREDMGIQPAYAGLRMYDAPIFGCGAADDPLFDTYKQVGVIGPWHRSPAEWLPEAKGVLAFFFPASSEVRASNREASPFSSVLWSYARIEGQAYISAFMNAVADRFRELGYTACVPTGDPRWQKLIAGKGIEGYPEIGPDSFGSSWSERHAAYVCGLGTFGLSKGLITEKGMAGRFGSVIVSAPLPVEPRPYTGVYDYCIRCGACVRRCPVQAIDPVNGKDHTICSPHVSASRVFHAPRYGCGLCQIGVPCETRIPLRRPAAD